MPIVKIPGFGTLPISINGASRDVPRGVDTVVSADELAVLRDSHVAFVVVDEKKGAAPKTNEAAPKPAQAPGGDHLPSASPDTTPSVVVPGPEVTQEPGADSLTTETPEEAAARVDKAREEATQNAADATDGTTAPVEVLTNADPNQDGVESGAFDPNAVLNGSAANVTAQLSSFSDEQIATLIVTEKKGKNRSGLLAALEAKLA